MAQSSDDYESSASSEDERNPAWISSQNIKNTEDLEVHNSETDTGEEEEDEEKFYLDSAGTEDISSTLGPGASPPTVTETKREIVSSSTILQAPSDIRNV